MTYFLPQGPHLSFFQIVPVSGDQAFKSMILWWPFLLIPQGVPYPLIFIIILPVYAAYVSTDTCMVATACVEVRERFVGVCCRLLWF